MSGALHGNLLIAVLDFTKIDYAKLCVFASILLSIDGECNNKSSNSKKYLSHPKKTQRKLMSNALHIHIAINTSTQQ